MSDDYSAYLTPSHNNPDEMAQVAILAEEQWAAEEKVAKLEAELAAAKEALKEISEKKLPELMETLGISSYKTTSGLEVDVKEVIRAHISEENKPSAFGWLEANESGGIIKSEVVSSFGRDEIDKAKELVDYLLKQNRPAAIKRSVHAQTLMAYVRERLAAGKDIPIDLFGVLRQRVSKVGVPKAKKSKTPVSGTTD